MRLLLDSSALRADRLQHLRRRARFDLNEDVSVLPIAAVKKLVGNAGFAPDHLSRFFIGLADAAVVESHLVFAFGQRHDQVGQPMLVPRLTPAGIERHAPHSHDFVLEQNFVADRSQHAHRYDLPAMISYQLEYPDTAGHTRTRNLLLFLSMASRYLARCPGLSRTR